MKYKSKYIPFEYYIITKFLWFPKKIGNITKWLETATFQSKYLGWNLVRWHDIEWLPKIKETEKNNIIKSINDIINKYKEDNSNGECGLLTAEKTIHRTKLFMFLLSYNNLPIPELSVEPDGAISLNWIKEKDRMFSVSIKNDNIISCAWINKDKRGHYNSVFIGISIPNTVIENINRTMSYNEDNDGKFI